MQMCFHKKYSLFYIKCETLDDKFSHVIQSDKENESPFIINTREVAKILTVCWQKWFKQIDL